VVLGLCLMGGFYLQQKRRRGKMELQVPSS
jgi:hypothetical protein